MTKSQYTNKSQITITKDNKLIKIGIWPLVPGIYLEFGHWNLGFSNINFKHVWLAWIVCTAILLSTIPDTSYAFKQTDLDKLLAAKQCQWCDLRNADLSDAQLSGAQIANANLSGANLSGADFSGADFSGAVMSGANLHNANLSGAYLRGAKLQNADLSGADLSKARLNNANLLDANLTDANFSGANLSGATWKDGIKCDDDTIERCTRAVSPANRGSLGGGIPF